MGIVTQNLAGLGQAFGRPMASLRSAEGRPDKNCFDGTMVQCCKGKMLQLYKKNHSSADDKAVTLSMRVVKARHHKAYDGGKGEGMWSAFEWRRRGSPRNNIETQRLLTKT